MFFVISEQRLENIQLRVSLFASTRQSRYRHRNRQWQRAGEEKRQTNWANNHVISLEHVFYVCRWMLTSFGRKDEPIANVCCHNAILCCRMMIRIFLSWAKLQTYARNIFMMHNFTSLNC